MKTKSVVRNAGDLHRPWSLGLQTLVMCPLSMVFRATNISDVSLFKRLDSTMIPKTLKITGDFNLCVGLTVLWGQLPLRPISARHSSSRVCACAFAIMQTAIGCIELGLQAKDANCTNWDNIVGKCLF